MENVEDIEFNGDIPKESEGKQPAIMSEAQAKHIEELIQYLIFLYNNLTATVVDAITEEGTEDVIQFRVSAEGFSNMLESIKVTAGNFAEMIGAEINAQNGEEVQEEQVDGE